MSRWLMLGGTINIRKSLASAITTRLHWIGIRLAILAEGHGYA